MLPALAVQVTFMFVLPVTEEMNCCVPPDNTYTLAGVIDTDTGLEAGVGAFTETDAPA